MNRKRFPTSYRVAALCAVLIVCLLFSSLPQRLSGATKAADENAPWKQTVQKALVAIEASATILKKLENVVAEETGGEGDSDTEFDPEKAENDIKEVGGDMLQLKTLLSSLDSLIGDMESGDGRTVLAAKEFLTMLYDISSDMHDLFTYAVGLYEAMMLFESVGNATTYVELSDLLSTAANGAISIMDALQPPSYLKITHDDLVQRFKEMSDLSEDFFVAGELSDTLRLQSSIYRVSRIVKMLENTAYNLMNDITLQFRQVEKRLSGPVATLYDELTRNISELLAA